MSKACLIAMLGVASVGARAHDTWLLPQAVDGRLGLTSGMAFPQPDHAIEPARIAQSGCTNEHADCSLHPAQRGAHALRVDVNPVARSVVAWVDLAPKTLTLSAAKVDEYFEEIEAGPGLRAAWMRAPAPRRWIETYTKHAKSIVGPFAAGDAGWRDKTGQRLEIVAEGDPTRLISGAVAFVVLFDHEPLVDAPVALVDGSTSKRSFVQTDQSGHIAVAIGHAGPWLLAVTHLQQTDAPKATWQSDFATLSFIAR